MQNDEQTASESSRSAARARSHMFAVRLWKHESAGGSEYRGSVREVISGAFLNFRDWSELSTFMMAQMDDDESARPEAAEGAT